MTDLDPERFDAEPEDAWHPDDPPSVLIANLIRRRARERDRDDLEAVRRAMFDEDLAHVLNRVADLEGRGT